MEILLPFVPILRFNVSVTFSWRRPPPPLLFLNSHFSWSFSVLGSVKISVHPELFWKSVASLCHFWCSEFISHSLSLNLYHLVHSFIYTRLALFCFLFFVLSCVLALAGRLTGCWHLTEAAHLVRCGRMWEGALMNITSWGVAEQTWTLSWSKPNGLLFLLTGIPRSRPVWGEPES